MVRICTFVYVFFFLNQLAIGQTVQLSGFLNRYAQVSAIDDCTGRLDVSDTTGFRAGNRLIIIQMQGSQINSANNAQFGEVTDLGATGRHEWAYIDSVAAGAVYVQNRLVYAYQPGTATVQIATYPVFKNAVITDTLRAQPWDGKTGGLLALEVTDTLTINAPVLADGAGFRGGISYVAPSNNCTWVIGEFSYFYAAGSWRGAFKGEGVGTVPAGRELGRGPQANGGGGGNDHNSGGGGGGHLAAGGTGGENNEPSSLGCDGNYPGIGGRPLPVETGRIYMGGGGGAGHCNNTPTGAGGQGGGIILLRAGTINGSSPLISAKGLDGTPGFGDGGGGGGAGGTVRLEVSAVPTNLVVQADGGSGGNTNSIGNRCIGPGGGGAGGRIIASSAGIAKPAGGKPGIIVNSTNGCNGSTSNAKDGGTGLLSPVSDSIASGNNPFKPQAAFTFSITDLSVSFQNQSAGGQTYLWDFGDGATSAAESPQHVYLTAGVFTVTLYVFNICDTAVSTQKVALLDAPKAAFELPASLSICQPALLQFTNTSKAPQAVFKWFFPGGQPTTSSDTNPNVQYAASGTYTALLIASNAAGSDTISRQFNLTVLDSPVSNFSFSAVSAGVFLFTSQSTGAAGQLWEFGDGSVSTAASPTHVYSTEGSYLVRLTVWNACDTVVSQQNLTYLLPPQAVFFVADTVYGCDVATVVFENKSSANSLIYSWTFPGGSPATSTAKTPAVSYSIDGIYSARLVATNAAGSDTTKADFWVQLLDFPAAEFSYSIQSGGKVAFFNDSQNALVTSWDFGDGSPVVTGFNVSHTYTQSGSYTVTLIASNPCGAVIYQQEIPLTIVNTKEAVVPLRLRIYPNPADQFIFIEAEKPEMLAGAFVRLFDLNGRLCRTYQLNETAPFRLQVDGLASGLYQVVVNKVSQIIVIN